MENRMLHIKNRLLTSLELKVSGPMIIYFLKKGNKKIQKFVLTLLRVHGLMR